MQGNIVYHGSNTPGLTHIEANWPPPGGLGFGVYVDYDIEVAKFYSSGYIYKLRLLVPEEKIYVLDSTDYDTFQYLPSMEGTSVLIGEQVPPFAFKLKDQWVTVSNDEGIARRIAWEWFKEDVEPLGDDIPARALASYIEKLERHGDAGYLEDLVDDLEEHIDWEEIEQADPTLDLEDEAVAQAILDRAATIIESRYGPMWKKRDAQAEKLFGYVVDLEGVGTEVREAGYRAIYVTGIREGGSTFTELLVFDPDDLEMIGEVDEDGELLDVE